MIELSELIRELRAELQSAMVQGASEELRFEVGPVELELNVGVTKEGGGGAKVKFWVVEVGAQGKGSQVATQRVKLTLQPKHGTTGESPLVTGESTPIER